jgi:hypothetical protein
VLCRVDLVLVGAEGVVENGGVINKLGTYQIALCAKVLNKPFYVAAESYKFARLYPLNQQVGWFLVLRRLCCGTAAAWQLVCFDQHGWCPGMRSDDA